MSKRGNIDHFYFPVLPTLPAFTDLFSHLPDSSTVDIPNQSR